MRKLSYLFIGFLLCLPLIARGQNSSLWKFVGSLRPVVSSWRVDAPGGLSGSTLTTSTLRSCSALETNSIGAVSCGTDDAGGGGSVNSGAILDAGNPRFVNVSGDTMTGKLLINAGVDSLEVIGTASGRIIHAQDALRSSGSLAIEGNSALQGAVSIVQGALSDDSITEADLKFVDSPADEDIMTYESTTGDFEWHTCSQITGGAGLCDGTDADTSQNLFETIAVSGQSDIVADSTTDTLTLAAGSNVTITTNAGTDTATIACTDTNTTYTAGEGLTLTSTTFSRIATMTGTSLEIYGTASGRTVHAQDLLRSSGALALEGGFFQTGLADCDNAGETPVYNFTTGLWSCGTDDDVPESGDFGAGGDLDADGTITDGVIDKADFTVSTDFGNISTDGSSNLTIDDNTIIEPDLSADNTPNDADILTYDSTGTNFAWITPNAGTDIIADLEEEGVTCTDCINATEIEDIYVFNTGDLMTGDLEVAATASGRVIHAQDSLRSSGSLLIEGLTVLQSSLSVTGNATFDTTTLFVDSSSDEVGIGTITPDAKLDLENGALRFTNSADSKSFEWGIDSTNDYHYLDEFGSARHFKIRYGGNVSIGGGTTEYANDAKLEVFGTMSGQGLTVNGRARIPRMVEIPLCDAATACATGSGSAFIAPIDMNNYFLSGAILKAAYAGTTNTMNVQLRNIDDAVDVFSTTFSLDSTERSSTTAATPGVINASNRTITTLDVLVPFVSAVHTTPAKGVTLLLHYWPK